MRADRHALGWLAALGLSCAPTPSVAPNARDDASGEPTFEALTRAEGERLLCATLARFDCDGDTRITVLDEASCPDRQTAAVVFPSGRTLTLEHVYQRSQLVSALALATVEPDSTDTFRLDLAAVLQNPAQTLHDRIETLFWPRLTRRIEPDLDVLRRAAKDPKLGSVDEPALRCDASPRETSPAFDAPSPSPLHVYVPATDPSALAAFAALDTASDIVIHPLAGPWTPSVLDDLTQRGAHGLLTLAIGRPFVVPGGRFNELYGWDSAFIVEGLLQSPGNIDLARSIVDNLVYEIEHYHKILNANRTYYLTRSQPPLLTSMIRAIQTRAPSDPGMDAWVDRAMRFAIQEYEQVWTVEPRRTSLCAGETCLARYFGEGAGPPPETEPGHFTWFYQRYARRTGACKGDRGTPEERASFIACARRLAEEIHAGRRRDPTIDAFFVHDRAMRESGHDTTFRWYRADADVPDQAASFATIDLNALLLRVELDVARWVASPDDRARWCQRAMARASLLRTHLYDEDRGLFFDYDIEAGRRSTYLSATTLYPLWATQDDPCGVSLLTRAEMTVLVDNALAALEVAGGLAATARSSLDAIERPRVLHDANMDEPRTLERQWDYPYGWAPHQILAWQGLLAHGFDDHAQRLIYRWLYTIVRSAADYHGTVPEKYDVVARSHQVFAEYGNVNTDFRYIATEGFGWMNASYMIGWNALRPELRARLTEEGGPSDPWSERRP